jgi:hypothetical protein
MKLTLYYSARIVEYHNSQGKCCLTLNCFVIEETLVFEAGGPPVEERRDHLNNSQEEER